MRHLDHPRPYRLVRPAPPEIITQVEAADEALNRPARHLRISSSPAIPLIELIVMLAVAAAIGAMLAVGGL